MKNSTIAVITYYAGQPIGRKKNICCPYGQVGDRLWVRETWATERIFDPFSPKDIEGFRVATIPKWYKAGDTQIDREGQIRGRWRSSRFIPKWASRITLEITEVRVEKVQEITPVDCLAEGFSLSDYLLDIWDETVMQDFAKLWDSLNAKRKVSRNTDMGTISGKGYGWEVNPWVWVISFKRYK